MNGIGRGLLVVALLLGTLAACSTAPTASVPPPANPAVDEAEATEMARSALEGYNAGDYARWTRDWSPAMKAAIPEAAWRDGLDEAYATLGRYVSIDGVELVSFEPGTYGYTFTVTFERKVATVRFAFVGDSPLVDGVHVQ
jgi:hypothetical protein